MLPIQITFRDMPASLALENILRKKAEKLTQFYNRIINCRIVVELPQKNKHQGKLFNVRVEVAVPGKQLAATHKKNQDIYIAIRNAFGALGRQLEEHARKRHGQVKVHDERVHGHISRIMDEQGYGFIQGTDGNEYYFSLSNVKNTSTQQLGVGDAVEFSWSFVSDGRQAHHILKERVNGLFPAELEVIR